MALPSGNERYDSYTDQLVYFSARLAADPKTKAVAGSVQQVLAGIDEAQVQLREARRAEVLARARRDHEDDRGDKRIARFRRRLDVHEGVVFMRNRLFPRGLTHLTRPRGRAQIERLQELRAGTEDLLASERLDSHEESEALRELLKQGLAEVDEVIAALEQTVSDWEQASVDLARARDLFRFRRSNGVAQLGAVMGELRALLGGDARAAYAYTVTARRASVVEEELLLEQGEDGELDGLG